MQLDKITQKNITRNFLKSIKNTILYSSTRDIYKDLAQGKHTINIVTRGKYTISEIKYTKDGYEHHFLGVSAKNPKDSNDKYYGIKVATEQALMRLFIKFLLENTEIKYNVEKLTVTLT